MFCLFSYGKSFLFALGPVSEWLDVAIETKDVKGKTKAKLRTLQQLQVQHSIAVMKEMATELMTLEAADDAQIQRVSNLIEAVAKHMKTQDDPSTCANLAEVQTFFFFVAPSIFLLLFFLSYFLPHFLNYFLYLILYYTIIYSYYCLRLDSCADCVPEMLLETVGGHKANGGRRHHWISEALLHEKGSLDEQSPHGVRTGHFLEFGIAVQVSQYP